MKTTIETINGQLCTVVRKPFDAEMLLSNAELFIPTLVERILVPKHNHIISSKEVTCIFNPAEARAFIRDIDTSDYCFVTNLSALPRHPENNEATIRLLHAYGAAGLRPQQKGPEYAGDIDIIMLLYSPIKAYNYCTINHAIDTDTGERVEIALEG